MLAVHIGGLSSWKLPFGRRAWGLGSSMGLNNLYKVNERGCKQL